jgi:hypothetical protein
MNTAIKLVAIPVATVALWGLLFGNRVPTRTTPIHLRPA